MTVTTATNATDAKPRGRPVFLSAEWRHLVLANYEADPAWLRPFIPAGTELDLFGGKCFVSLVGFMFHKTKILGILPAPGHESFEEINLRFYVTRQDGAQVKRAVVFIKEVVPSRLLAWTARFFYYENYVARPTTHAIQDGQSIRYGWGGNSISCRLGPGRMEAAEESFERWITEHYWGYTRVTAGLTYEYEVRHPVWQLYPVESCEVKVGEERFYGNEFDRLLKQKPSSVFAAEGSPVTVHWPRRLKTVHQ
ncbi:MAG TPA: DUF2071 domain-containing protein [Bdellovibrionales bacterium]|nr:DUF2071 domain-containing protein [Bdellovibrionales bacterium]